MTPTNRPSHREAMRDAEMEKYINHNDQHRMAFWPHPLVQNFAFKAGWDAAVKELNSFTSSGKLEKWSIFKLSKGPIDERESIVNGPDTIDTVTVVRRDDFLELLRQTFILRRELCANKISLDVVAKFDERYGDFE